MQQFDAQMTDIEPHTPAHYSAQQIAQEVGKGESTIRTRWFDWLIKVAPAPLLRTDDGYTELARTLFAEFAQVKNCDRTQWVTDAKQRYSQEWASAGVIDGELMPDEVGGTLALMQSVNLATQSGINGDLADLQAFITQVNEAEVNFSEQELEAYKMAGVQRGIARFKVETQAEIQTLNTLRQQRMGGPKDA